MILYPAIDLYDGMAVRLRQGRYDDMTVYDRDPKSLALRMRDAGATHLHMVDRPTCTWWTWKVPAAAARRISA